MSRFFQTSFRRARLTLSPLSAEQMAIIGATMVTQISTRIKAGKDVNDAPAKPLVERYAKRKIQRNRAPIRDWFWRGLTLGSFKVKRASEDSVTIGFVNAQADMIAHANNLRVKQFGTSPADRAVLLQAVRTQLIHSPILRMRPVSTVGEGVSSVTASIDNPGFYAPGGNPSSSMFPSAKYGT